MASQSITVIGAGVVGMATAVQLQAAGHEVEVIDRLPPGEATSFGNAGGIPCAHPYPLGMPGLLWKVPGYLLNPLGPLALRPSYLPRLAPWLMSLLRASRPARAAASVDAILGLMRTSEADWKPLLDAAGIADLVRPTGCILPYRSEKALKADAAMWAWPRERGLPLERLGPDELRQLEPTLSKAYTCAMFEPEGQTTIDPHAIVTGLAALFAHNGGTLTRETVADLDVDSGRVCAIRTNRGRKPIGTLVLCAGAWSRRMAERIGTRVPVEACRGYHINLPQPGTMPRHMVVPTDFSCAITPMRMGLRLAGTAEFAGLDAEPDWRRARKLVEVARAVFPGIETEGYSEWAGNRPLTPDSVPIIDRDPNNANVIFAFGHGFYGLTLAAITGRLVTELVAGAPASVDLKPYRVSRF